MPRPTKAYRRQRLQASAAWKRGEKEEAYKLWEQAAKSLKEHREKKKSKNQPGPEAVESPASEDQESS